MLIMCMCSYIVHFICDLVIQVFQVALILELRTSYVLQESLDYFQQYKTAAKIIYSRLTCTLYNKQYVAIPVSDT